MVNSDSIRWLIRRDMESVLSIESSSFEFPWSEEDFLEVLRMRNHIGMVIQDKQTVIGYMIYELRPDSLHIVNLAITESYRRAAYGTQMIQKLIGKLSAERRTSLVLEVQESNLSAQLFFKSLGFRAIEIIHDFYEKEKRNAYRMRYQLDQDDDTIPTFKGNRIAKYLPKETGE